MPSSPTPRSNPDRGAPVRMVEDERTGDRFFVYATERGIKVELRYEGDTFWASQAQMADMFGIDRTVVGRHIRNVFDEGELPEEGNVHSMHLSPTKPTKLYSLNAMISVGYRVESKLGTMFRIWATDTLFQVLTKGFYIDKERLKDGADHDRIRELRETIRDIRASEANTYAELKRICAMCQDYDGTTEAAVRFYTHMQAKLFYAVTSHTPAAFQRARIRADAPNMGLQTWPKDEIRQQDALVAKNALAPAELTELNRVTVILLDIFEDQLDIGKLTKMSEAEALLDAQLKQLNRPVLRDGGRISRADADRHVKEQFKLFDKQRKLARQREADADLTELRKAEKTLPKATKKKR